MNRKRGHTPGRKPGKARKGEEESVEVVCRLTPYYGDEDCLRVVAGERIMLVPPSSVPTRQQETKTFEFGAVFTKEESQRNVFERCASDLIEDVLQGKKALLFTYGVTGSGKTYTMTGNTTREGSGILPRTLDTLFNSIEHQADKFVFYPIERNQFAVRTADAAAKMRRDCGVDTSCQIEEDRFREYRRVTGFNEDYTCSVFISYVEVYNNAVYDLLATGDATPLNVNMDAEKEMYVGDVREVEVTNADEALQLLADGDTRRSVSNTLLNKESSRSHSVFSIKLVMAPLEDDFQPSMDSSRLVVGQLALVDLAGSERAKRTQNTGERLLEASKINQSLSTLRRCIKLLRSNQRAGHTVERVPYRESKITTLFMNHFEGGSKIRLIVCANPSPFDYAENLNVMQFAEEAQSVQVAKAEVNMEAVHIAGVPRHFYNRWNAEVDIVMKSTDSLDAPSSDAKKTRLTWGLRDPSDDSEMVRIRQLTSEWASDDREADEKFCSTLLSLERSARDRLVVADYQGSKLETFEKENERLTEKTVQLRAQNAQFKRQIEALRDRLSTYENDDEDRIRFESELREARKADAVKMRRQQQGLEAAFEIATGASPSVAQLRTRFASREQLVHEQTTTTVTSAASGDSRSAREGRRADRPAGGAAPLTAMGGARVGYYNPRHRRSQSASRVLDHQPLHKIPTGNVMRVKMPPNARTTTAPRAAQLKCSDRYILESQNIDEEGNVSTSVIKGDIIPTAGGGTAVTFNDIERLTHDSPHTSRL